MSCRRLSIALFGALAASIVDDTAEKVGEEKRQVCFSACRRDEHACQLTQRRGQARSVWARKPTGPLRPGKETRTCSL
jgi:hypothetical protein